ncbi:sacsin N-terminal ATP-binding-like domain-containing protein [Chitinophaga eiseniae]|uniref:DUF3883 domain-containing protein n=1 Tax=Chitinophaga eiseniae TaxID=634771 RepID=A0A847SWX6_9BACT|nr:DUF3883 domain-containing protein [Chitinophaga eiseniae]NLR83056.1 DUF3883 domain-containing protein [Chitinophaga eiseniae]
MNKDSNISSERQQDVNEALLEDERSDLQQHADKMLRGFENFNDSTSSRAIWELVQNACDLTTDCQITIDYRNGHFSFSHNGRPFKYKTLISLIKQVSGDKDDISEIPPVGKYGTGFITTHSLGRYFCINSYLELNGKYIALRDFTIDRSAKKREDLIDAIRIQKNNALEIIKSGSYISSPDIATTFLYHPITEQEKTYVKSSLINLHETIPIILAINNRLRSIKIIIEDGQETDFKLSSKEKISSNVYSTRVFVNKIEKVIYSLIDEVSGVEIVLPINKDLSVYSLSPSLPRLFLYYPLIGSEKFGINFIINCKQFMPSEARDGIHLYSNKDQLKDQEEVNRVLLKRVTELIFTFLKENPLNITDYLPFAEINFARNTDNNLLNEYFTNLQINWISQFETLKVVGTKNGLKSAKEVTFIHPSLLSDETYRDCIYHMADKFFDNIPLERNINEWSNFAFEWQQKDIRFINQEDIAKAMSGNNLVNFDTKILKKFYEYLISCQHSSLFTQYKLIPNLEGEFLEFNNRKNKKCLSSVIIKIGRTIIPETIKTLVHEDFDLGFQFSPLTRRDCISMINTKINETIDDHYSWITNRASQQLSEEDIVKKQQGITPLYYTTIHEYCRLSFNIQSASKPYRLMELISKYYGLPGELIGIDKETEEEENLGNLPAQKKLAKVFFNCLSTEDPSWVAANIDFLSAVISCKDSRFEDIYKNSGIYSNQLFSLHKYDQLKVSQNLTPFVKDLYNTLLNTQVEGELAHETFNDLLLENEIITDNYLSAKIEEHLFNTDSKSYNEHPHKKEILTIIKKLNEERFQNLFYRLNEKKANIMLELVNKKETKEGIFAIVSLGDDKIQRLGELVQDPNFEQVLAKAEDALRLDAERTSDFQHKLAIGTYIEAKIKERIQAELATKIEVYTNTNVSTENEQGGQDIIIYKEKEALYYIEVKSRWNSNSSVMMSKLQLERASQNADRYALIVVDITKYGGNENKYQLTVSEIIPLVKVLRDIGNDIFPLIDKNLTAESNTASHVRLVDYRGLINQNTIANGESFDEFISFLIDRIKGSLKDI